MHELNAETNAEIFYARLEELNENSIYSEVAQTHFLHSAFTK